MYNYQTIKIANLLCYYYQKHVVKYCEKVYERSGKNIFLVNQNSCEVLNSYNLAVFVRPVCLHTSILHYILPAHNVIKDKLVDLIERAFKGKAFFICM